MKKIKWHFPETLDEAVALLGKKGVVPHAGGTSLMIRGTKGIKGFIDLGKLPLKNFSLTPSPSPLSLSHQGRGKDQLLELGAMLSFDEISSKLPDTIIGKALVFLPPALKSRITLGGSVAIIPPWSDLLGPLVALDAEVILAGKNAGSHKITDFANNISALKEGSLISGIRFKTTPAKSYYYRATRTCFDYGAFNISILAIKMTDGTVEDLRIVIAGCKEKFVRLTELEKLFINKKPTEKEINEAVSSITVEFHPKKLGSPEYIKHLCRTELERGLNSVIA